MADPVVRGLYWVGPDKAYEVKEHDSSIKEILPELKNIISSFEERRDLWT